MTEEADIAELRATVQGLCREIKKQHERIQELEADRKSALITALLLIGGGFVTLFTILARKAGVL